MTEFGAFDPRRVRPRPRDRGTAYIAMQHDRRQRSIESKYGFVSGTALAGQLSAPTPTESALSVAAQVAAKSSSFEDFKHQLLDKATLELETRHYNLEIDKTLGATSVDQEQQTLEQEIGKLQAIKEI